MSYQKKSLILQELEQAIRKKAQEKSRNKEQVGYLSNYAAETSRAPSRKKSTWCEPQQTKSTESVR